MDDSHLAPGVRAFLTLWRRLGGDPDDWTPEHRFAPPRRWRFDLAHRGGAVAVEVDGGTWTGGRHVRGAGYRRDAEKLNAAAALGWFVYRLTPDMASDPDQVAAIMAATAAVDAAGRG